MKTKLAIALILLAEIWIWTNIRPQFSNPDDFKWFLIMVLGIITAYCLGKIIQLPKRSCTLYGIIRETTFEKKGVIYRALIQISECGWPAQGMLRTKYGRTEYFCERHDPENDWMAGWLEKNEIEIEKDKIIRFK